MRQIEARFVCLFVCLIRLPKVVFFIGNFSTKGLVQHSLIYSFSVNLSGFTISEDVNFAILSCQILWLFD